MTSETAITFAEGQIILDAFRLIHGGTPLFHVKRPTLDIPGDECEAMLDRIRHAKVLITSREPRLSREVFRRIRSEPLAVSFDRKEMDSIVATLEILLAEAEPNPPHIKALVARIVDVRRLISKLQRTTSESLGESKSLGGQQNH